MRGRQLGGGQWGKKRTSAILAIIKIDFKKEPCKFYGSNNKKRAQ